MLHLLRLIFVSVQHLPNETLSLGSVLELEFSRTEPNSVESRLTKIITVYRTYLDLTKQNSKGEKYPFRSKYVIYSNFCLGKLSVWTKAVGQIRSNVDSPAEPFQINWFRRRTFMYYKFNLLVSHEEFGAWSGPKATTYIFRRSNTR